MGARKLCEDEDEDEKLVYVCQHTRRDRPVHLQTSISTRESFPSIPLHRHRSSSFIASKSPTESLRYTSQLPGSTRAIPLLHLRLTISRHPYEKIEAKA